MKNSTVSPDPKLCRRAWLCCAALVAMVPGAALAAGCGAPVPAFRLSSDLPPPDYRHELTRPQIGALGGHGHMTNNRRHAGLTQTRTDFSIKPTLAFQRMADGSVCASLSQVEVNWRMTRFRVDVAAEYRRGSCPYDEILRHEKQHVTIHQRAFAAADRGLREELGETVRRFAPFVLRGSSQQAANEVAARLMAQAKRILEKYERETNRENAAIDTPESYRAVSARCRDW